MARVKVKREALLKALERSVMNREGDEKFCVLVIDGVDVENVKGLDSYRGEKYFCVASDGDVRELIKNISVLRYPTCTITCDGMIDI